MADVIFLYGPPASGKSTRGRELAARRGVHFVDLDEEIVRREGQAIPEIFASRGEPGFRAAETAALHAVVEGRTGSLVVSLGGGTLLAEANRTFCEAVGNVFCLPTPSADELARRLGQSPGSRPLGDQSQTRRAHYASFPLQVGGRTRAIVSLGSNIEPRRDYLRRAVAALVDLPWTKLCRESSVIETAPVDVPPEFVDQKFLNQIVIFETELAPLAFSRLMHEIEDRLGRVRTVRNGPRTIDIDLIDFGGLRLSTPELTLPHPRAHARDFVLTPLREVIPEFMI